MFSKSIKYDCEMVCCLGLDVMYWYLCTDVHVSFASQLSGLKLERFMTSDVKVFSMSVKYGSRLKVCHLGSGVNV